MQPVFRLKHAILLGFSLILHLSFGVIGSHAALCTLGGDPWPPNIKECRYTEKAELKCPKKADPKSCETPYPKKQSLQEILEAHQKWLCKDMKEEDPGWATCNDKSMTGQIIVTGRPPDVIAQPAILCGADLRGKSFKGRNLRGANLQDADLRNANLEGANFARAKLRVKSLKKANVQGANFQGADMRNADLREAKLKGSNLQNADLRDAHLGKANLEGANLEGAKLNRVKAIRANFTRAKLIKVHACRAAFNYATFTNAELNNSFLQLSCLKEAILQAADLSQTNLQGTNLEGTDLKQAQLSLTRLSHTVFEPKPGTLPKDEKLFAIRGLKDLRFDTWPHGLRELRHAFKALGMRKEEREVTYAQTPRTPQSVKRERRSRRISSVFGMVAKYGQPCVY